MNVPSLTLLNMETFIPFTEVGFKVTSYMRMYRIFLDWNTGGSVYVSWLLDASLFSFWWHVLTSCVISDLLYFKAGTWLPWIQAVHFTSECEYSVECWFALPRMLFSTLHWPSWACFTHFSMIHQLRFLAL